MFRKSKWFPLIKHHYFILLVLMFLFYSAIVIFRSSFVIHGIRYFSLSDDEMISMRYAYNLAHGHGLVWNPGREPIEGFTNPLWVLYMALIHLLPISLAKTSLVIQISAALCMAVTLYLVKRIAGLISNSQIFIAIFSVLFTAFYFPLINWTVILGTEVSLLTLLLTWSAFLTLQLLKTKRFSFLLFILLGIGTLVRMDFLVPALVIALYLLYFDKNNRKQYILFGLPIIVFFLFMQTAFRLWYYHDILPNTYYLKMTGYPLIPRITAGIYVGLKSLNWAVVIIPFVYAYFARNKKIYLLLLLFAAQLLYSVYVGGDAWEELGGANRYVAIAMPLFFIGLFTTLYSLRNTIKLRISKYFIQYTHIEWIILLICFIIFNTNNRNALLMLFLVKAPHTVIENATQVHIAEELTKITKPNAKIGIVWAGITPYFTQRCFIDLLGKNEKVIAHEQARYNLNDHSLNKYIQFWPGHMKWDYPYVIRQYKPDVFGQIFPDVSKEAYFTKDYVYVRKPGEYEVYVLKNTKNVTLPGTMFTVTTESEQQN